MTESHNCAGENLHKSIVANYLRTIVENEEKTIIRDRQVLDVRERFLDLLTITSKDVDSSCSYELVTSPVYTSYLASWGYEENRRMGGPDTGKDLFELQCIVQKQNESIQNQQKRIIEMRNCFQILLHNMAKDEENSRFLTDYLLMMESPVQREIYRSTQSGSSANHNNDQEFQRLHRENEQLKQKLQDMSDRQRQGSGPVYNFFGSKSVYLQSTKNVVIQGNTRYGSITSATGSRQIPSSESTSTNVTPSSQASPTVFRTKDQVLDHQQGVADMKLLNTALWTQTIQSRHNRQSSTNIQMEEETKHKRIYGHTLEEEISTSTITVEFQEQHNTDVKENRNRFNQMPVMRSTHSPGTGRSNPDGSSCPESLCVPDTCPDTSSLLGLLFTGFCHFYNIETIADTVDINNVPYSFLVVLKRIRIICRYNYKELCEELNAPQGDVITCSTEAEELRALNTVIQTWLRDQHNYHDRDTLPHMKMIKILNKFRNIEIFV